MEGEHQTLESLLRENIALSKENNKMLRDMQRMGRIVFWAKAVIWTLVIILPLIFIGPILDFLSSGVGTSIMGLPSPQMIEEALRFYQEGQ